MSVQPAPGPSWTQRPEAARRRLLGVAAYVAFLLAGLLVPFDPYRVNDAAVVNADLEFRGAGIARSATPPRRLHEQLVASGALSVEVVAESASVDQRGPARLVSYSLNTSVRNFTLGQQDADLHVRIRTPQSGVNGVEPYLAVEGVFDGATRRHIVVTYDGTEERVYVDGALRTSSRALRGSFENWSPDHVLVLGNEATGLRPWRGRLGLVAVYDRALSPDEVSARHASLTASGGARSLDGLVVLYRFAPHRNVVADESGLPPPLDLQFPTLVAPPRVYLDTDREYLQGRFVEAEAFEIFVNLVIFVPLGFLVARAARAWPVRTGTVVGLTLAVGALLSLTVETVQYFLISRYSELGDVILNTIGTALGLPLALVARRRPPAPAEPPGAPLPAELPPVPVSPRGQPD